MTRKTIEQRIALRGGEDILAQLRGLGTAGKKAFDDIRDAAARATGPSGAFARSLATLRARFQELRDAAGRVGAEFQRFRGSLNNLGSSFTNTIGRIAAFTAAIGAAVFALGRFVSANTAGLDEAAKTARSLGLAIGAYQGLQFAAEQSGVAQGTFEQALTTLNDSIIEARDSANSFVRAGNTLRRPQTIFDRLGVSINDANGQLRSTEDIIGDIAEIFARLPDGPEKVALSIDVFGRRAGPQLISFLNLGRQGIGELIQQASRLGVAFTDQDAAIAEGLQDSQNRLARSRQALQTQIALLFAPLQTEANDQLVEFLANNREAVLAFGEGLRDRIEPIVKDLFALLSGRDADVQNTWIIDARNNIVAFGNAVQAVITGIIIPTFNALIAAADSVAVALNGIFGTELTGAQLLIIAGITQIVGGFRLLASVLAVLVNGVRLLVAGFGLIVPAIKVAVAIFATIKAAAALAVAAIAAVATPFALIAAAAFAAGFLIVAFWDQIKAAASLAFDFIKNAAVGFWQFITQAFTDGANVLVNIFNSIVSGIADRFNRLSAAFVDGWRAAIDRIRSLANGVFDFLTQQVRRLTDLFAQLADAFRRLRSGSEEAAPGFATGGRVRGPGTGTSDSIPAWLSNGEFVIRASAVKKYGAGFFAALNNMRLPKVPGFVTGGLVDGAGDLFRSLGHAMTAGAPRFASGGLVAATASGRPVTINFGGEAFQMTAQDDVIDRLTRAAARRRVSSLGRRPGWYE
jgi:hypothetical protein